MEKNLLEPEDIEWKYHKHLTFTNQSHFCYRDEKFGLQWEQLTNRDGHGWSGKAKNYYFIDGQKKEYTDVEELCKDWNEIKNFDDPDNEIVWEKKIVPTIKLRNKTKNF